MRAHHRHVAGVIMHAVFLLVGRVVLLIDHDETEIGVREKQRRACADHDLRLARCDRCPGAGALARRQLRMPFGGRTPKRCAKRSRNWPVSAISGISISDLLAAADRLGNRLEIDFRLAGAGDAVEQRDMKPPLAASARIASTAVRCCARRIPAGE